MRPAHPGVPLDAPPFGIQFGYEPGSLESAHCISKTKVIDTQQLAHQHAGIAIWGAYQ